jgi:hypothetical protein
MTEHEITLDLDYPQPEDPGELIVTCSCGEILWTGPCPVQWAKISLAVAEHLRPQAEAMMKELLKMVSFKDIIRTLRTIRKLSSADRLVLDQDHPGNQRDQQDRCP